MHSVEFFSLNVKSFEFDSVVRLRLANRTISFNFTAEFELLNACACNFGSDITKDTKS